MRCFFLLFKGLYEPVGRAAFGGVGRKCVGGGEGDFPRGRGGEVTMVGWGEGDAVGAVEIMWKSSMDNGMRARNMAVNVIVRMLSDALPCSNRGRGRG